MNPDFISAVSGAVGVAAATPVALLVARGQIRAMAQQAMMAHRAVVEGAQIQTTAAGQAQTREARRAAYIPFTAAAHELYELLTRLQITDMGNLRRQYKQGRANASRAAALVDLEGPDFLADLAHDVLRKAESCMDARRRADQILDAKKELTELLTAHCQTDEPFVSSCMHTMQTKAREVPDEERESVLRYVLRRSPVPAGAAIADHVQALRRAREQLDEAVARLPTSTDPSVPWSGEGLRSARSDVGCLVRYAITHPHERHPLDRVRTPLEELQKAVSEFVKQARTYLHEEAVRGVQPPTTSRTSNR